MYSLFNDFTYRDEAKQFYYKHTKLQTESDEILKRINTIRPCGHV